jgi:parallel beta-helix repeat protein
MDGAGFLILGANYVVISGFEITNAPDAGIQVRRGLFTRDRSVVGVTIANNTIFNNGRRVRPEISRGIDVVGAEGTTIFNNLLYRNGTGIGVLSSPRSKIINNTIANHPRFGVVIAQQPGASITETPTPTPTPMGSSTVTPATATPTLGPSTGSWLLNNIIAGNATGAGAFSVDVDRMSGCDYVGAFNLIDAAPDSRYSGETPRDRSDILADPRFVDPVSDDYRLRLDSPAIDAGSDTSTRLDLRGGTVLQDGARDMGPVDLGYHLESITVPTFDEIPATTQEIYVRADGDDAGDGSKDDALRTVTAAIDRARAVSRVIVGPGVYRETIAVSAARPAGPIELFADAHGRLTGDEPGRVVIDAHRAAAGINVVDHCSTVIDGFVVMNGDADGIRLKGAHRSIVRHNTTHSNRSRGINVVDTDEAQIFNNLSYANVGGIQVGGASSGSQQVIIENNTVFGNQADGILIGTGPAASADGRVRYNVIVNNGKTGLNLDSNVQGGRSALGLCVEDNVVFHSDLNKLYGPILPQNCGLCDAPTPPCVDPICRPTFSGCMLFPPSDLRPAASPLLAPVAGSDGCIGGRRFWDDGFWLAPSSNAINWGDPVTAESVGLNDRNTENCRMPDRGPLDAGYHALDVCFGDLPALAGDCNADDCVTVDEVVSGVNIVLEHRPLSACPAFDLDGDGRIFVNELVSAVNDLFCCGTVTAP